MNQKMFFFKYMFVFWDIVFGMLGSLFKRALCKYMHMCVFSVSVDACTHLCMHVIYVQFFSNIMKQTQILYKEEDKEEKVEDKGV